MLADDIREIIEPTLTDMGYDLVHVNLKDGGRGKIVQIMAEKLADGSMGIEDCTEVSHAVSALLDVEDLIASAYELEVGSPGIDRPLVRLKDFVKYSGSAAKIEVMMPVNNRRRYKGKLIKVENNTVYINVDGEEFAIDFDNIKEAKLVLTDELLRRK